MPTGSHSHPVTHRCHLNTHWGLGQGNTGSPHPGPDLGQAWRKAHLTPPGNGKWAGGEYAEPGSSGLRHQRLPRRGGNRSWGPGACPSSERTDKPRPGYTCSGGGVTVSQGSPRWGWGRRGGTAWVTPPRTPARQAFPSSAAPRSLQSPIDLLHRGPLSQNLRGPALLAPRPSHMLSPAQARRSTHPGPLPTSCSAQLSLPLGHLVLEALHQDGKHRGLGSKQSRAWL